ncbi:hypothetical protein BUALT_Bualt11G0095100 [Buddleja alternifolia]|uniref:Pentatricopeptide repeat-containing protein n=1 Tax=Buddleja alternifolia TaxID=168488 RepID=A0AAV6X4M0_9LAMI|nr:hypothetical protein BUALT_Bualt11G0095100 [Buddleja alternifolia]
MIGGYAKAGDYMSYSTFREYMRSGIRPDNFTLPLVMKVCRDTKDLVMGRLMHNVVYKLGFSSYCFVAAVLVDMYAKWAMHKAKIVDDYIRSMKFSLDVILGTAVIDMHAKCGNIEFAREIFDKMREKNVISWSTMIAAHGYHGEGEKSLDLFRMMLGEGILPNSITFVLLLYSCSHSGLVEEGLRLFTLMQEENGVRPDVKHFTCVVDLFGRAGKLDQALKMIEDMNIEKDAGLWGALLSACRIHGREGCRVPY